MFKALHQHVPDVPVIQKIVDLFAGLAGFYQAGTVQFPELVRDRGMVHVQDGGEVAHAELGHPQGKENLDTGGIAEELEKISELVHHQFAGGKEISDPVDPFLTGRRILWIWRAHERKVRLGEACCQEQIILFYQHTIHAHDMVLWPQGRLLKKIFEIDLSECSSVLTVEHGKKREVK